MVSSKKPFSGHNYYAQEIRLLPHFYLGQYLNSRFDGVCSWSSFVGSALWLEFDKAVFCLLVLEQNQPVRAGLD